LASRYQTLVDDRVEQVHIVGRITIETALVRGQEPA